MTQTYREILEHCLRDASKGNGLSGAYCTSLTGRQCRLCYASRIAYDAERKAKQQAVQQFWAQRYDAALLKHLLASPHGRLYRSISKRKVTMRGRTAILGLIDPDESATGGILPVRACAIEPASHQQAYDRVLEGTALPSLRPLFPALRYVIVRGDDRESMVILSVREMSSSIMKAATVLSKSLTATPSVVRAVYLHEDESDGRYYLGSGDPAGRIGLKKLFGVKGLKHDVAGKRFYYPPASFTQINHGILEPVMRAVAGLLRPAAGETLLDLYCGYGLFGMSFAHSYRHVLGADISPDSISAAQDNAEHQHARNARFLRSTLDADSVEGLLRRCRPPFSVILDPPRGGTAQGMVQLIAEAVPERIVHLFCNVEGMPDELARWKRNGYEVDAAVPVDMFPGTASIEWIVGLKRSTEARSVA
jgi:tRNA/tmRNA/rRNA uracil-C5-methylase (TrmA/RlmC/RlmD family)